MKITLEFTSGKKLNIQLDRAFEMQTMGVFAPGSPQPENDTTQAILDLIAGYVRAQVSDQASKAAAQGVTASMAFIQITEAD